MPAARSAGPVPQQRLWTTAIHAWPGSGTIAWR